MTAQQTPPTASPYAIPIDVNRLEDCHFYHTVDIPGFGTAYGPWDLRGKQQQYLGHISVAGKRVLEMGTSSGFFCFYMEKCGAEVVAADISPELIWDVIPYARYDYKKYIADNIERTRRSNNAFWLCYKANHSKARLVHCTVYEIPDNIGVFDVSTFGAILLHLRDPFQALQNAASITKETIVITDAIWPRSIPVHLLSKLVGPAMVFLPNYRTCEPRESWWTLPTNILRKFIGVLGFEHSEVSYHFQKFMGRRHLMYTIVGHRTVPLP